MPNVSTRSKNLLAGSVLAERMTMTVVGGFPRLLRCNKFYQVVYSDTAGDSYLRGRRDLHTIFYAHTVLPPINRAYADWIRFKNVPN